MVPSQIGGAILGSSLMLLLGTMLAGCGGGGGSSGGALTGTGAGSGTGTGLPGGVEVWHQQIALRDSKGKAIQAGSTTPYSPRKTCGACHDVDAITNGYHFQQGRTSSAGVLEVRDNYFADGRAYVRSSGMYGKW